MPKGSSPHNINLYHSIDCQKYYVGNNMVDNLFLF